MGLTLTSNPTFQVKKKKNSLEVYIDFEFYFSQSRTGLRAVIDCQLYLSQLGTAMYEVDFSQQLHL